VTIKVIINSTATELAWPLDGKKSSGSKLADNITENFDYVVECGDQPDRLLSTFTDGSQSS